jgi:hypothetical protein
MSRPRSEIRRDQQIAGVGGRGVVIESKGLL